MADIAARIWTELEAAASSRSAFNFLQLATLGIDGSPQVRTVVLRRADQLNRTITFVTDKRSPKAREIQKDPRVSLLGYDPTRAIQLRLQGEGSSIVDANELREMWDLLRPGTLSLFDEPLAPGTPIDAGPRADTSLNDNSRQDPQAFERFGVIVVRLTRMEFLELSPDGHRRFAIDRADGAWRETRISP